MPQRNVTGWAASLALAVAHRLETRRRQGAVGGHQVAERRFLAHRQHPAAVDHHLGVERGQAVDEAPPVLLARRRRLGHQPRVAGLAADSSGRTTRCGLPAAGGRTDCRRWRRSGSSDRCPPSGRSRCPRRGFPGRPAARCVRAATARCVAESSPYCRASMPTRSSAAATLRSPGQRRPQLGFQFGAADHACPGQIQPAVRPDRDQFVVDPAIELGQLRGTPLEPDAAVGRFGQKRRSLGKALRPLAGHVQPRVSLELGDRRVVQSPIRAGKLGIAVGRQPHGQARERRVLGVAGGQLPQHAEHRPLDARVQHVVVGGQSPPRRPRSRTSRPRRRRSTRSRRPPARRPAAAPPTPASGAANSTVGISCRSSRSNSRKSISSTSLRTGSWPEAKNTPVS